MYYILWMDVSLVRISKRRYGSGMRLLLLLLLRLLPSSSWRRDSRSTHTPNSLPFALSHQRSTRKGGQRLIKKIK
jgi:hypothetical protein